MATATASDSAIEARAQQIDKDKREQERLALLAMLGVLAQVKTDARFAYRHHQDIGLTIHPHPTLGEGVMEASMAALGQAVHVMNR